MKKLLLLIFIISSSITITAQSGSTKPLKKAMTLLMPRTVDDEMPGKRGASVVWHPLQKKYYAAMAGNMGFPLGVYDATGKLLSDDSLNTNEDIRGIWYNPDVKEIQGNTYNDYGWFSYQLNSKGIPVSSKILMEGMNQPSDQSVGAYSFIRKEVMFLYDGYVEFYSITDALPNGEPLAIQWGRTKADGVEESLGTPEEYNSTVIYTGIKGAELGFLNIVDMQIELYDINNGFLTRELKLPEDAPMNLMFNFAYTNGMYWLFNMENRTWTAYK